MKPMLLVIQLLFLLFVSDSPAQLTCDVLLDAKPQAIVAESFSKVRAFQAIQLKASEKKKINSILQKNGFKFEYLNHFDLISKLSEALQKENPDQNMENAQKLTEIGNDIQDIIDQRLSSKSKDAEVLKSLRDSTFKARYTLGEFIAKLEEFPLDEYAVVTDHAVTRSDYTMISLSEYPAFAMSLAKLENPPRPYGSGGVVTLPQYRDIVSKNLWLFTLEGHDLKHIHFANSHPLAAASMFRQTRSKNHVRYFLIAALYEGVDTVQYSFEERLAVHFSNKGYSLEEGMIYLASARQEFLQDLAAKIGGSHRISEFEDWIPKTLPPGKKHSFVKAPDQHEADILAFIQKSLQDLENPEVNYYMRPELTPKGVARPAGEEAIPGHNIHFE